MTTINNEPSINLFDTNDAIWFDIVNRTITPHSETLAEDILVQHDANSRNLGFMIQRYFEEEDLSTKRIRVHYVNSLNQHDVASVHSINVVGDEDDVVSFQWLVSDKVCAEGGNIQFAIEFYNDAENYRLFTKPTTIGITKGICTVGEFIEPESDWFKEYSSRMNVLEADMKSFNEAVENGEFDGAYAQNTFANAVKGNASGEAVRIDDVSPAQHTMDVRVHGKNLFDISKITSRTYVTNNNDGTLTVTTPSASSGTTIHIALKMVAPYLQVGKTYVLSAQSTGTDKYIYLTNKVHWEFGASLVITQEMLDAYIVLYASGVNTTATLSNIQIEEGTTVSEYASYLDPTTVTLKKCGKNFLTYPYVDTTKESKGITFTDNKDGSININGTATEEAYFNLQENVDYGETMMNAITTQSANNGVYVLGKRLFYNPINKKVSIVITQGTTVSNERLLPQLELGAVVTDWEQPKEQTTYTPNADGSVSGVTSLSPTTTLLTDTENVIIECEYNRDTNKALSSLEISGGGSIPSNMATTTADGTVVSPNADFAEVAEWADGNPNNEDRTGYFVCANVPLDGIVMKKAKSTDDVKGVTILAPAFAGNYTLDKLDSNGKLLPKYSYVAIIGFVPVRDNGTCTVGGRCMPDDNGCAIPSSNSMGYQVVSRIDDNRVLIIIEPNGDMVQRIKTKVQSKIGFWQPNTEYKVGDVVIATIIEQNDLTGEKYNRIVIAKCISQHIPQDYFDIYAGGIELDSGLVIAWEILQETYAYYDVLGRGIHNTYATKEETPTNLKNGTKANSLYQQTEKDDTALPLGFTDIYPDVKGQITGTYDKIAETGENATSLGNSIAKGKRSFASGSSNLSTGKASITNGADNYNGGHNTAMFGYANATATGYDDEGNPVGGYGLVGGSKNILRGANQTVGGHGNDVSGHCASAFGDGLIVDGYGQTVIGTYNEPIKDAKFIIGNGSSDDRHNIFVITKEGNAYINEKEMVTKEEVKLKISMWQSETKYEVGDYCLWGYYGDSGDGKNPASIYYLMYCKEAHTSSTSLPSHSSYWQKIDLCVTSATKDGLGRHIVSTYATKEELTEQVGNIETALDELHNYAQTLITEGVEQ